MTGKLLDEAVALSDRIAAGYRAEEDRVQRFFDPENDHVGNYRQMERFRHALLRSDRRISRRRRAFFPA